MNLTNVKRWIKASLVQLLQNNSGGVTLFIEGDTRPRPTQSHFELRVDGPYSKPLAGGQYKFKIEVNILINMTRDESNFYAHENLQGIASQLLNQNFCVYRIGNKNKVADDDGSLFGTMLLIPMEEIRISEFGKIDPNTEVYQSVVEAHYEMYT